MKSKIFIILAPLMFINCGLVSSREMNMNSHINQEDLDKVKKEFEKLKNINLDEEYSSGISGTSYGDKIVKFNHEAADDLSANHDIKYRTEHFDKIKELLQDLKDLDVDLDKTNKNFWNDLRQIEEPTRKIIDELDFNLNKDEWINNSLEEKYKKWEDIKKTAKKLKKAISKVH